MRATSKAGRTSRSCLITVRTDRRAEATQAADKTEDASEFDSEHAYLGSAIDADHERDADASKSEPPPSNTAEGEQPPPAKEEKKGGGGGFFKAIGLGGGKKKDEEKEAQAGAEQEKPEAAETPLPPNHLGSAVPEGLSQDLADPGTVAPGQTDGLAAQKTAAPPPPPAEPEAPRSPSTSAGKQPDRGGSVGSSSGLSPDRARSTGGGAAALPGSRGEHRGSMIPQDAARYKRVENPDRIPTAGGKRIGEEQYQTRRASMAPPASPPRDMARLDREGSPDAVTADNTVNNAAPASAPAPPVPEAKNTAPQQMKEFSMGDASKDAEGKPVDAGAAEDVAPDEGPKVDNALTGTEMGSGPAAAPKEKASSPPASGGKENTAGGHTRRGSVFDKLKEKMRGKK